MPSLRPVVVLCLNLSAICCLIPLDEILNVLAVYEHLTANLDVG